MDVFLVAIRLFLAAFLGAIIGVEREMKKEPPALELTLL